MKKIIPIKQLSVGYYLTRVVESEPKLQVKSEGKVQSQATIDSLIKRGVKSVEIDLVKSGLLQQLDTTSFSEKAIIPPQIIKQNKSEDEQRADLEKADKLYLLASNVQSQLIKQLRAGNAPDFQQLNTLSQDIIDSVFDNHEALSFLVMLKENSDYLVSHSLNCAILLSIFAHHMQLPKAEIEDLTLAGLLMDIGMALLPPELVNCDETYSQADITLMRTHVEIGLELLERYSDLPPLVFEIVANHHERINGSGYPKGKSDLSLHVQMATIVDAFDAQLTQRPFRLVSNSQDALESLQSNPEFSPDLVDKFIDALGLYPVGTLVQLQSGKLAMIFQSNKSNHLKPKVMAFYHIKNKHYIPIKIIDLKRNTDKIMCAVRPEEFNVNLPKFFRMTILP